MVGNVCAVPVVTDFVCFSFCFGSVCRQQRNLKQKFIALLKRFKITEDLQGLEDEDGAGGGLDGHHHHHIHHRRHHHHHIHHGQHHHHHHVQLSGADLDMDAGDIDDLIDELEDLSDSGPEMDTLSVTSTPKPSLRPFFASSRSLAPDLSGGGGGGGGAAAAHAAAGGATVDKSAVLVTPSKDSLRESPSGRGGFLGRHVWNDFRTADRFST